MCYSSASPGASVAVLPHVLTYLTLQYYPRSLPFRSLSLSRERVGERSRDRECGEKDPSLRGDPSLKLRTTKGQPLCRHPERRLPK